MASSIRESLTKSATSSSRRCGRRCRTSRVTRTRHASPWLSLSMSAACASPSRTTVRVCPQRQPTAKASGIWPNARRRWAVAAMSATAPKEARSSSGGRPSADRPGTNAEAHVDAGRVLVEPTKCTDHASRRNALRRVVQLRPDVRLHVQHTLTAVHHDVVPALVEPAATQDIAERDERDLGMLRQRGGSGTLARGDDVPFADDHLGGVVLERVEDDPPCNHEGNMTLQAAADTVFERRGLGTRPAPHVDHDVDGLDVEWTIFAVGERVARERVCPCGMAPQDVVTGTPKRVSRDGPAAGITFD